MHDEAKVICIKDLKIFKNADEKEDSQVASYNAIIASGYQSNYNKSNHTLAPGSLLAPSIPPIILSPLTSFSQTMPNTNLPKKTRSGRISQPPKQYDAGMNNDIKVLLSQLAKILDIPDRGINENSTLYSSHLDECDPLIFLTQKI